MRVLGRVRSSVTGCRSTCARSRRRPTRIRRRSPRRCGATRMSWTASWSSWRRDRASGTACEWSAASSSDPDVRARTARGCLRRRRITPTPAGCSSTRSAWQRSAARRRNCIRGCARDLLLAAALLHDVGRIAELTRRSDVPPDATKGGCSVMSTSGCGWSRSACAGARARRACRAAARHLMSSRCACRAHGRGVGAVSRESARRGRCNAAVTRLASVFGWKAIALALGASLTWGFADFFGPLKGRTFGALRVLVYVQLGGLLVHRGDRRDTRRRAGGQRRRCCAIPAAISGTLGLYAYYRGDGRGRDEHRRAHRRHLGRRPGRRSGS